MFGPRSNLMEGGKKRLLLFLLFLLLLAVYPKKNGWWSTAPRSPVVYYGCLPVPFLSFPSTLLASIFSSSLGKGPVYCPGIPLRFYGYVEFSSALGHRTICLLPGSVLSKIVKSGVFDEHLVKKYALACRKYEVSGPPTDTFWFFCCGRKPAILNFLK